MIRVHFAIAVAIAAIASGCKDDRAHQDQPPPPVAVPTDGTSHAVAPPMAEVSVTDVRADPTIDPQSIRSALSSAEAALLTCVAPGSGAGVLVMSFPIERDGSVGDIVEGTKTTFGSEAARICMEKIVATMRFPRGAHDVGRADVTVTLEVTPRR